MEVSKENKMASSPMLKLIISMSIPAMFSMLIQSLYNIVDSIFVSRISDDALTAVSLAFPVQTLMIAVGVGTGVGLNSLISRRLGEHRQEEANSAASHGLLLAVFSWVLFALFGLFFTRMFFEAFTSDAAIVQLGCDYTQVVTIFSVGVFVELNTEKTLQATGDMKHPMFSQLIGAITNIILDPIMIFGYLGCPAMGIRGAAIATVTGQIFAMIYLMLIVAFKEHEVKFEIRGFRFHWKTVRDIYAVGIPSIIMQSIAAVLTMALNNILIAFSDAAVSVLGIYYKLQSFVFMPVFGLTQGVMPIMGYNYGARNKKRLMDALKIASLIAVGIMLVGTLLFSILPKQLLMLFETTDELLQIGIPALRIISLCFVFAAMGIVFSTLFQAVGSGINSLIISVLRQLVVILPAAYWLSKIWGLGAVWYAFPIAEIFSFVASMVLFAILYKRKLKELELY